MERKLLIRLVTRAQNGDSGAMDELFTAFYDDVYYFALKTLKDEDTACDITQETFLEIIRTIGSLKEPVAFVTWMRQVAYHQCTRYFKKKKEVLVEEDEDGNTVFDTLADESEGSIPSEVLEQEEFRSTILAMINELTEEQRSAVMLYYFDELPVGQIAGIQGVSEGTVKSRLNYARKSMKKSVEEYEKKHNIKLHSFSFLPLFLLFFGKERMPQARAAQIRTAVANAAAASGAGVAAVTGTAAVGAGVKAKLMALPLAAKIAAGVAAAAILVGSGLALTGAFGHKCRDLNGDRLCDVCEKAVTAAPEEAVCDGCGVTVRLQESLCPDCVAAQAGDATETQPPAHGDENGDGYCDCCGAAMCALEADGAHPDGNGDCICDECGFVGHTHGQDADCGSCAVCGVQLGIQDEDGDGVCDLCGQSQCDRNHPHADADGDGVCDFCRHYMCEFWQGEHYVNYDDGIYDSVCDHCGQNAYGGYGYGEDDRPHADENGDGICECCGDAVCRIYGRPEFGGADENGDNKCDICDFFLCDGHSTDNYHMDLDHDGKCDLCDHYICAHGFVPHTDGDADGKCDNCYGLI